MFLGSHFLNAVYNLTLEKLEKELKAIMRQISQHVSMGHQAEIGELSFIFSGLFFKHLLGGGIILDTGEKSINRPDKNLYPPESYIVL